MIRFIREFAKEFAESDIGDRVMLLLMLLLMVFIVFVILLFAKFLLIPWEVTV